MNLHNEIMNIQCKLKREAFREDHHFHAYKIGHKESHHSAAELSLKAEARIEELVEVLKAFVNWTTPVEGYGSLSLLDDEELWKRAEEVLNNELP